MDSMGADPARAADPHANTGELLAGPEARWEADAALLAALRDDEPSAVRALHARFAPLVNRLVWRTLGDPVDHDDVVQDIFVAVIEGVGRVRNPRALEGWIIQVTLHKVRSCIRSRSRQRGRVDAAGDPNRSATFDDHEARDLLVRCARILARFPEKEAKAFLLCHVDGRELAEAAALCDCSLSSLKRWLARAEERFRRRVADDPILAERLARAEARKP